ncbi:methyl-accepting chemotaxis protein [uncultured Hoeflea sp.]|uniref:methyl-accepting chemotaxis protein n=1 Tax=uncultured Hoeflea sp. TaxID=538666 RepID=UPI0030D79CDE
MHLSIQRTLIILGIVVSTGLLGSIMLKKYIFDELKINGVVYHDIALGKDLVSDISPPPLYVVESYMLANEMVVHPTITEKNKAKIDALRADYRERRDHWSQTDLNKDLYAKLRDNVLVKADTYWAVMDEQFLPVVLAGDTTASTIALGALYTAFHDNEAAVDELAADAKAYRDSAEELASTEGSLFSGISLATNILSMALLLGGLFLFRQRAIVPLTAMKDYMGRLATGDYSMDVPYADRTDEIGEMAQSVAHFRQTAIERSSARQKAESEQAEKQRQEAEIAEKKAEEDAARVRVIDAVTAGLEHLSAGDLAYRINEPFAPEYEKLKTEFNASISALAATIDEISSTTESVRLASSEIGASSDDLSKRTEQQAASLEETAAALDEITSTVKSSSQRAEEASTMVGSAKAGAEKSGTVVKNAISAMDKIEESSKQISQIISVIDDIAFQTNLLALNAGVEAARAGEAGKGFAVVAQEVRELAGRSATAAKEIKTLIDTSSTQVGTGVTLVNETGTSLTEIEGQVSKINDLIQSIVTGAREQSTALAEINAAINQMDQTTQQNAAMVEQTNAATQGLSGEAVRLESLVRRFNTGGGASRSAPAAANAASRPAQSPARALGAKVASAFGRGGGAATARREENWSEF